MSGKEHKQPYVRFFPSDWLGGTRGMKAFETGVYITLIALMYERCDPLPEDHKRLARQCGTTEKHFKRVLEMLVDDRKITRSNGHLWNDRVQREFDFRQLKSHKAKESVSHREKKRKENKEGSDRTIIERSSNDHLNQKPEARSQKERKKYRFEGKVIRLNEADYESWQTSYHAIPDLHAALTALDAYYADEQRRGKKLGNWFVRTSTALSKKHQEWLAKGREPAEPRQDEQPTYREREVIGYLARGIEPDDGELPNAAEAAAVKLRWGDWIERLRKAKVA